MSENNQKRLFKEIVQFNPEKLQAGGGIYIYIYVYTLCFAEAFDVYK
jgi:phosphoribosylformimino-5-aminoimidazole carboxamide ribonucleotide (ProFAR) isomerase